MIQKHIRKGSLVMVIKSSAMTVLKRFPNDDTKTV